MRCYRTRWAPYQLLAKILYGSGPSILVSGHSVTLYTGRLSAQMNWSVTRIYHLAQELVELGIATDCRRSEKGVIEFNLNPTNVEASL